MKAGQLTFYLFLKLIETCIINKAYLKKEILSFYTDNFILFSPEIKYNFQFGTSKNKIETAKKIKSSEMQEDTIESLLSAWFRLIMMSTTDSNGYYYRAKSLPFLSIIISPYQQNTSKRPATAKISPVFIPQNPETVAKSTVKYCLHLPDKADVA